MSSQAGPCAQRSRTSPSMYREASHQAKKSLPPGIFKPERHSQRENRQAKREAPKCLTEFQPLVLGNQAILNVKTPIAALALVSFSVGQSLFLILAIERSLITN